MRYQRTEHPQDHALNRLMAITHRLDLARLGVDLEHWQLAVTAHAYHRDCRELDLDALEAASLPGSLAYGSLIHDLFGLMRYYDIERGQARECFVPRFAAATIDSQEAVA